MAASLVAPAFKGVAAGAGRRPNIVFFLIDDMGWMDSEPYGSTFYETPNISRLAREGMLFTDAYAQPLCSPTRAAIMTGKYAGRVHLHRAITRGSSDNPVVPATAGPNDKMCWPQSLSHLPLDERTIAEEFRDAGYHTWFLGKWHLGAKEEHLPIHQGFDLNIGAGGPGPGSYFAPYRIPEIEDGPDGEYICERLTDEACTLLEKGARSDKPFFLYFAHFNVHAPYQAKPELVEHFKRKADPEATQRNPVMAAMLYSMDESVGKVLEKLDELQLADDTLVVFVSDNGGCHWNTKGAASKELLETPITSNEPLRGGKCSFYEGGVRVPLIVRWPGKVKAASRCSIPVHVVDFYPTLLEAVGAEPASKKILDGESIVPLLTQTGGLTRDAIFCHFPRSRTTADTVGGSFVRQGDYKLICFWGDGPDRANRYELYNLRKDIGESMDLSESMPEKVSKLSAILDAHLDRIGAKLPIRNPAYDPNAAAKPAREKRARAAGEKPLLFGEFSSKMKI